MLILSEIEGENAKIMKKTGEKEEKTMKI